LWTALLTAISAGIGVHDWLPFALNLACSVLVLIVFCWGLERMVGSNAGALGSKRQRVAGAIALPLVLNLPALTFCGLEHILHALLTLTFTLTLFREPTSRAKRRLPGSSEAPRPGLAAALPYMQAAVLPLVRLEALFTVAAAAIVWCRRGRAARAAWLVLCAGAPWLVLSGFMYQSGGFLLPNSIVAKAVPTSAGTFLAHRAAMIVGLLFDPLLVLLLGLAAYAWRRSFRAQRDRLIYFSIIAALHLTLSSFGVGRAFDRYESYLVTLGLLLLLSSVLDAGASARALVHGWRARAVALYAMLGVVERLIWFASVPYGANDVYEQHYQLGRLIERHFAHASVVVNDIGVASLRASGPVTDLAGLGSTDVLRVLRRASDLQNLRTEDIEPILRRHGADLIAIYPEWFSPTLYRHWQRVARWELSRPSVTAAFPWIVFYAPDEARGRLLLQRLRAFEPLLPREVRVRYEL
jgi:hypothetical protein